MKSRKFRPYIRRARGDEHTNNWRIAIRLGYYRLRGKPFFVMVQHGFPRLVMEVMGTKRELKQSPFPVARGRKTFRRWSKDIQRHATNNWK